MQAIGAQGQFHPPAEDGRERREKKMSLHLLSLTPSFFSSLQPDGGNNDSERVHTDEIKRVLLALLGFLSAHDRAIFGCVCVRFRLHVEFYKVECEVSLRTWEGKQRHFPKMQQHPSLLTYQLHARFSPKSSDADATFLREQLSVANSSGGSTGSNRGPLGRRPEGASGIGIHGSKSGTAMSPRVVPVHPFSMSSTLSSRPKEKDQREAKPSGGGWGWSSLKHWFTGRDDGSCRSCGWRPVEPTTICIMCGSKINLVVVAVEAQSQDSQSIPGPPFVNVRKREMERGNEHYEEREKRDGENGSETGDKKGDPNNKRDKESETEFRSRRISSEGRGLMESISKLLQHEDEKSLTNPHHGRQKGGRQGSVPRSKAFSAATMQGTSKQLKKKVAAAAAARTSSSRSPLDDFLDDASNEAQIFPEWAAGSGSTAWWREEQAKVEHQKEDRESVNSNSTRPGTSPGEPEDAGSRVYGLYREKLLRQRAGQPSTSNTSSPENVPTRAEAVSGKSASVRSAPRPVPLSPRVDRVAANLSMPRVSTSFVRSVSDPEGSLFRPNQPKPSSLKDNEKGTASIQEHNHKQEEVEGITDEHKFWADVVIPRWNIVKSSPLIRKIWSKGKQGVPANLRATLWKLALGNRVGVGPDDYYRFCPVSSDDEVQDGDEEDEYDEEIPVVTGRTNRPPMAGSPSDTVPNESPLSQTMLGASVSPPVSSIDTSNHLNRSKKRPGSHKPASMSHSPLRVGNNLVASSGSPSRENRISIETDVARMFPKIESQALKKKQSLYDKLRQLLEAFCNHRPDITYVQGMSYLGQVFLQYMEPPQAFGCMCNLVERDFFSSYIEMNVYQIRFRFQMFELMFEATIPELFLKFQSHGLMPDCYLMEWFLTLFSKQLPLDVACVVWDGYFLFGEVFVFQAAVGLLTLHLPVLMRIDSMQCLKLLRSETPNIRINVAALLESIEKVVMPPTVRQYFLLSEKAKEIVANGPGHRESSVSTNRTSSSSGSV